MIIKYEDVELGVVRAGGEDLEDWENEDGAAGHFARSALYSILTDHPKPPGDEKMAPQAWFLTVLKLICSAIVGKRSEPFEQQVFKRYTRHYGLTQMGTVTGQEIPADLDMAVMFGGRG